MNLLKVYYLSYIIPTNIKHNKKWIVGNHNFSSLYIYHQNSVMRDFYQIADYVHIDTISLFFLGKLLTCKILQVSCLPKIYYLHYIYRQFYFT